MDNYEYKSIGDVPFIEVKKALEEIEKNAKNMGQDIDKIVLSFEFLVGSFFPQVIEGVRAAQLHAFIEGYEKGKEEKEE